jgi:hypothetical protein
MVISRDVDVTIPSEQNSKSPRFFRRTYVVFAVVAKDTEWKVAPAVLPYLVPLPSKGQLTPSKVPDQFRKPNESGI